MNPNKLSFGIRKQNCGSKPNITFATESITSHIGVYWEETKGYLLNMLHNSYFILRISFILIFFACLVRRSRS
ncbi:MAG: hypothetical protein PHT18_04150, partial [Proteiniphilum sp.]|nr:hypothetical protein [Proteiniphilum sp.]